ncbi:sporulation protein YabP [Clostridium minihomine]|uniref:sporulation protein YabP n=1 Tax=Clostridium minihomine TaxID=2045012 RepID=UPI000C77266B|nr:sporulation protein YabP [Clostridium minihomine]
MAEEKKTTKTIKAPHSLIVDNRKAVTATGVSNVDSFDDQTVVAYTDLGELVIRGKNLQIGKLNTETGELTISGEICSMSYTDQKQSSGGMFSKLFR